MLSILFLSPAQPHKHSQRRKTKNCNTAFMEAHKRPHAIVFPYPYQGHITPMTNLSITLASRGFAVTFVLTEFIHHTLSKAREVNNVDIFGEARGGESGLDIRCMTISDGFPLEFDRDLNFDEFWDGMLRDFPGRVDELVGGVVKTDQSAKGFLLVADTLYTWPATIAKKHDIVYVSLWTEPATVFFINYHMDLVRANGHFPPCDDDRMDYIPGVEPVGKKDLMSYIQNPDAIPLLIKIVDESFDQAKNADVILCNTVRELEPETLSALNQYHPTYAIGPINFFPKTKVQQSLWSQSDCSQWLHSKPPGSVLYVSFGSIALISKEEVGELAQGLLLSRVNFIWVIRPGTCDSDVLPVGFEDDIRDRGLIIPWCNQNMVLSSPATGGFLTHCGWNSVLESMWNGVPMICHPLLVDQPTNRKLVVENWKIGINLCDGDRITREEVVSKIDVLMSGKTSVDLKQEIKKVSKILHDAIDVQGSSHRNLDRFVEDLKARLQVYV